MPDLHMMLEKAKYVHYKLIKAQASEKELWAISDVIDGLEEMISDEVAE